MLFSFFDKTFSIKNKQKCDGMVLIKSVSKDDVKVYLTLYTSKILLIEENAFEIMETTHCMDVPYVTECCTFFRNRYPCYISWK